VLPLIEQARIRISELEDELHDLHGSFAGEAPEKKVRESAMRGVVSQRRHFPVKPVNMFSFRQSVFGYILRRSHTISDRLSSMPILLNLWHKSRIYWKKTKPSRRPGQMWRSSGESI
jgi:hypothetical protein